MKYLKNHEIINHGRDGSQYFPGCGSGGHDYVVTGMGDTLREALADALDQVWDAGSGCPGASLERVMAEHVAQCDKAMLDLSCHADCGKDEDGYEKDEGHDWHHYASIRWTVDDVVINLDNEDREDGMVLVLTETGPEFAEAAEDDQTLDGSTWEDSGDHSPCNLIMDRVDLVKDLQAAGYELDLTQYTDPAEKEIACASCKTEFVLANAAWSDDANGLICPACVAEDDEVAHV